MLSRHVSRTVRATAPQRALAVRAAPARAFAAATAPSNDGRPPMAVFGVDGTYATALYTAASKSSTLDPTARALASLAKSMEKDAKLVQILSAPTLTAAEKSLVVAELLKLAGATNSTFKNFLDILAENNRLSLLTGVCRKFADLMSASRGELDMTITSAQPLDNRTLARLETAVSKSPYVAPGKKLKIRNEVNPDIVGGLVVEVGDRTIDLSVSSRIAKMNKLLTDTM